MRGGDGLGDGGRYFVNSGAGHASHTHTQTHIHTHERGDGS